MSSPAFELKLIEGTVAERGDAVPSGLQTGRLWYDTDLGSCWIVQVHPTTQARAWVCVGREIVRTDENEDSVQTVSELFHFLTTTAADPPAIGIGVRQGFRVQVGATPSTSANALLIEASMTNVTALSLESKVDFKILVANAPAAGLTLQAPGTGETAAVLLVNIGGTITAEVVTLGAVDSGGTGFRALVVPNS